MSGRQKTGQRQTRRIFSGQLVSTVILAAVSLGFGWVHAYSALVGGLIATLANGLFARRVFAPYRAQAPENLLHRFYGAEVAKLALVGVLFAASLLWIEPLSLAAFFGVFLIVYLLPSLISLSS